MSPRRSIAAPPRTGRASRSPSARAAILDAIATMAPGLRASPLPTAVSSLDGRFLFANLAYCQLLGRSLEQLLELGVADVTHPEDATRDTRALRALAEGHLDEHQIHKRYLRPDGSAVRAWTHVGVLRDEDQRIIAMIAHALEMGWVQHGNDRSAGPVPLQSERSFHLFFATNPQPMWIYDLETLRFLEVNDAACAHYGYSRREFLQRSIADVRATQDPPGLQAELADAHDRHPPSGIWRHRRRDGQVIEVDIVCHEVVFDGRDAALVAIQDVTERNVLERQLIHQALHDSLTGLPNRALFLDRLGQALSTMAAGGIVGILYVDLDGFQLVNQSLGHEEGDALLAALGGRLHAALGPDITVANIAGEEFALLAPGLSDISGARQLAQRVQSIIGEPMRTAGGEQVSLSACVGVAVASWADADPSDLVRDAAIAAARARDVGPGQISIADAQGCPPTLRRLTARHELRQAIETGEIAVYYQPVVSLHDGHIV